MDTRVVILLEDNEFSANVIRRMLEIGGYGCAEAHTEEEALAHCRTYGERVEAMISELILPGFLGTDAAVKAEALVPGLPILFVSSIPWVAWPHSERGKVASLPSVGHLDKPFRARALLDALSRLVRGKAMASDV